VTDRPGPRLASAELVPVGEIVHPVHLNPWVALKYCTRSCTRPDPKLTAATVTRFRPMSDPSGREPPRQVWYELDEALALVADLEDARDALIAANQLGLVVTVEHQIRILSHKLGFDDWPGPDNH
jgi:hypothetical protein